VTSKQEATAALDKAINDLAVAEEWTGVITGWVVLAGFVDMDEGEEHSGVAIALPEGYLAWPHALGIVEAGRLRMQQQYLAGED
jgi:hypothetical protein